MKSKAQIKGHPLHPMLIAFPVALLSGALLFDLLYLATGKFALGHTACYMQLAGIIGGLVAAVPGAIDYFYTVPPKSTGKARATKHALLNVSMIVLFSIALYLKRVPHISSFLILGLEVLGFVLLAFAGWMGGTLVFRNQIGVDPRYAGAGKWKAIRVAGDAGKHEVAGADELKTDQMKLIRAGDRRIVLARTEEGYVAFDDRCTHRGGSLAGGAMICGTVQCPWHGSQFDVTTGAVKAGPAKDGIGTYTVQEEGGKVYLILS